MICPICRKNYWISTLKRSAFELLECYNCTFTRTVRKGFIEFNDSQYEEDRHAIAQFRDKRNIYQPAAKTLMDIITKQLPNYKGKTLLDVGCGLGWLLAEATKKGLIAEGIDSSRPFIKIGRKLLKVNSKAVSLEKLSSSKKYDVIVLQHVIEHVSDLNLFLRLLRKRLNRDGLLVIACPNKGSLLYKVYKDSWYALAPGQHLWHFTAKTLAFLLAKHNFSISFTTTTPLHHQYRGLRHPDTYIRLTAKLLNQEDQLIMTAIKH